MHGSPLGADDTKETKERLGWPTDEPFHVPDDGVDRGAYVLQDPKGRTDVTLLATGSEVHLALDAAAALDEQSIRARVVSMPSMERFENQSEAYRREVLPPDVPTVAVEAGITRGWHHLVGDDGAVVGLDRFGLSGPGEEVYEELGFTVEHVVDTVQQVLEPASESMPAAS